MGVDSYKCDKCIRYFKKTFAFNCHMLSLHQIGLQVYKCRICGYKSYHRERTITHTKTIHKVNSTVFKCPYCEFQAQKLDSVKQHMKNHHSSSLKDSKKFEVSEKIILLDFALWSFAFHQCVWLLKRLNTLVLNCITQYQSLNITKHACTWGCCWIFPCFIVILCAIHTNGLALLTYM
jgi:hypothetical protein